MSKKYKNNKKSIYLVIQLDLIPNDFNVVLDVSQSTYNSLSLSINLHSFFSKYFIYSKFLLFEIELND